ncbi:MAG: hypothetical protein CMO12_04880, partial [Thaumarchaeota archaeon]|nr:hypothetical protein [Nitrososphaerota archaeon]
LTVVPGTSNVISICISGFIKSPRVLTPSVEDDYSDVFLAIVAIPSVVAELAFTFWLFFKAGKQTKGLSRTDQGKHSGR